MRSLATMLLLLITICACSQEFYLFTGTYTRGASKGIYVYSFNAANGEVTPVSIAEGVANPSFLSLSPSGKYVYAVNENGGDTPGEVSAFAFDRSTGQLKLINKQLSGSESPCYIATDASGKWVTVGHYTGGTLAAFQVEKNGGLKSQGQLITHTGSSANKQRQEKAHVHATVFSPDQRVLFVPDLGMDKIMIYRFDPAFYKKPLTPSKKQSFVKTKPGSGPRHLTFHPTLPYAYLIEELQGTISVYQYNQDTLKFIQNISSHPPEFNGTKGSADIHVSPDGKFLYASNRGDANNLAIFSINGDNGKLAAKGFQSTMGTVPRNFLIDPTGNYLLVANQQSSNIVIFKRDKQTGQLQPTGKELTVPNPVCLVMMKK